MRLCGDGNSMAMMLDHRSTALGRDLRVNIPENQNQENLKKKIDFLLILRTLNGIGIGLSDLFFEFSLF